MFKFSSRRGINSKMFVILSVTMIWLIADMMLEFVFPTYLETLGKSFIEIGVLLSLASVSGLLIDLQMGHLSDRVSRRRLMVTGLILSIIASVFIFSFKGNLSLAIMFLFWGFSFQFWKIPRDSYFASLTDKKNRGFEYGFNEEVSAIASTAGPIIGGFVFMYFGFSGIINSYVALLAFSCLLLMIFVKDKNRRPVGKEFFSSYKLSSIKDDFREFKDFKAFGIMLMFASMMFTVLEGVIFTIIPLLYFSGALNLTPDIGGLLFSCFFLPGVFFALIAGKIADVIGRKKTMFLGLIVMGFSSILFSISQELNMLFLFALLLSFAWIFSSVSRNALVVDMTRRNNKGRTMGILNFFMDIGYVIGPFFAGLMAEFWGLTSAFTVLGFIFIALSVLVLILSGLHKKRGWVTVT